jgi:hypothetical protein
VQDCCRITSWEEAQRFPSRKMNNRFTNRIGFFITDLKWTWISVMKVIRDFSLEEFKRLKFESRVYFHRENTGFPLEILPGKS